MERIDFYKETLVLLEEKVQELQNRLFMKERDFEAYRNEKEMYIAGLVERGKETDKICAALPEKERELNEVRADLLEKERELNKVKADLLEKERELNEVRADLLEKESDLFDIKNSLTWKIGRIYERYFFGRKVHFLIEKILSRLLPRPHNEAAEYPFSPYDVLSFLKDIEVRELTKTELVSVSVIGKFSLIATVKNEQDNIYRFLSSIESQTVRPDEVVIVDGGSSDGTVETINGFVKKSKLKIKLLRQDVNIAKGRNIAVENTRNDIVLATDAGCLLENDWCETIIKTFSLDPDADLVAGIFKSSTGSNHFIWDWDGISFKTFLPSSRNVAFKKVVFEKAGGYPEWLTLTGEDTLFDINARRFSKKWIIVKDLVVWWNTPSTHDQIMNTAYSYGKGDGESGIGDFQFYHFLREHKKGKTVEANAIAAEIFRGYLEGRKARSSIEMTRRNVDGYVLILAGEPFAGPAGTGKGAQLAMEYTKANKKVFYVYAVDSGYGMGKSYFDMDYTLLELYRADDFDVREFVDRYRAALEKMAVVVLASHPIFDSIINMIENEHRGLRVSYDYLNKSTAPEKG